MTQSSQALGRTKTPFEMIKDDEAKALWKDKLL
jgi:hypothetical protein